MSHTDLETLTFEKYGMKFTYGKVTETRAKWDKVIKEVGEDKKIVEWEETGETTANSYVKWVQVQDDEYCKEAKDIRIYFTTMGLPMLAIELDKTEHSVTLLDPCILNIDDQKNNRIDFHPVFGVGRTLTIYKQTFRAELPPPEAVLAAYPGFLIQHRMFKYQLKGRDPFHSLEL